MSRKVLLVLGEPTTGKTTSLAWLVEEKGSKMAYINFDKKEYPSFDIKKVSKVVRPSDPLSIIAGARKMEENKDIEYVVLDTFSFWIEAIEKKYIINSADSRSAWGNIYAKTIYDLLDFINSESTKNWIILSHVVAPDNSFSQIKAEVKGAIGKRGLEAFFDVVVYTVKAEDEDGGVKYGFVVKPEGEYSHLSVRAPSGMFDEAVIFPNDIRIVLKKMDDFASGKTFDINKLKR